MKQELDTNFFYIEHEGDDRQTFIGYKPFQRCVVWNNNLASLSANHFPLEFRQIYFFTQKIFLTVQKSFCLQKCNLKNISVVPFIHKTCVLYKKVFFTWIGHAPQKVTAIFLDVTVSDKFSCVFKKSNGSEMF